MMSKKTIAIVMVMMLLVGIPHIASAVGITFTAKPGALMNTAEVGIDLGMVEPYFGMDLVWISVSNDLTDSEVYQSGDYRWQQSYSYNVEGSALMLIPHLGAKFNFGKRAAGEIRPFVRGSMFMSLVSVSVSGSEEESESVWYDYMPGYAPDDSYHWENDLETDEAEDIAKELLSFFGIELAFGAEYFFTEKFSLGGEFGVRAIMNDFEVTDSYQQSGQDYIENDEWKNEMSIHFRMSYAVFNLNFYFL